MANGNGNGRSTFTNGRIDVKTVVEWAAKTATFILVPLLVWVILLLIQLDKTVAVLEASKFPMEKGWEVQQSINSMQREMTELHREVSELQQCQIKIRLGLANDC